MASIFSNSSKQPFSMSSVSLSTKLAAAERINNVGDAGLVCDHLLGSKR